MRHSYNSRSAGGALGAAAAKPQAAMEAMAATTTEGEPETGADESAEVTE